MKNLVKCILFALTAALLFASMLQKWFPWREFEPLQGVVVEQPKPELSFGNFAQGTYQQQTEPYLKQHFGYREPLIRLYNQYLWDFYHKTPVEGGQVVFGKNDWLYEPWVVTDYYQKQYLKYAADSTEMASMLAKEARRIYQLQQILEPYGVHLFASMVPSKDLVYPEYLPDDKDTTSQPKISARFFNEEEYTRLGVNHLNLEQYFLQIKDTADFLLFPKTGTHWSRYASLYAADTLIRYMEHLGDMNIRNLVIGPRELAEARETDKDLESLMNLSRPMPKPKCYYATTSTDGDSTAQKPKMIVVGDSFWWCIALQIPLQEIFSSAPYWYYNSTIYYDKAYHSVDEVNLVDELLSADFITLFYSSTQQYRMNNEFPKKALVALCYDPEEIDSICRATTLKIQKDSSWMAKLTQRAEANSQPLDVVLYNEASWLVDNYPEIYLPALKDSIPSKRSKRVDEFLSMDSIAQFEWMVERTMRELRNDQAQMESIRQKAIANGKTEEEALLDDARWIVNHK